MMSRTIRPAVLAVAIGLATLWFALPGRDSVNSAGAMLSGEFEICASGPRITCVVDGDTVWFEGTKYRFEEIDTPEKGGLAQCMQEGLQAIEATKRLAEILSTHNFTIETSGKDRYGRVLARFRIAGTTAGQMLVSEGLARPWSGRRERWCE